MRDYGGVLSHWRGFRSLHEASRVCVQESSRDRWPDEGLRSDGVGGMNEVAYVLARRGVIAARGGNERQSDQA